MKDQCPKCGFIWLKENSNTTAARVIRGLCAKDAGCPFVCNKCSSISFQWKAVRDISYVWPIPLSKTYLKEGAIERPAQLSDAENELFGRNNYGVLLSTGPGYWAKKSKCCDAPVLPKFVLTCKHCDRPCFSKYVFHPTQYVSKGKVVMYDKYVPWRFYPKTPEGREEMVVICGFGDIKGVVDDYDWN